MLCCDDKHFCNQNMWKPLAASPTGKGRGPARANFSPKRAAPLHRHRITTTNNKLRSITIVSMLKINTWLKNQTCELLPESIITSFWNSPSVLGPNMCRRNILNSNFLQFFIFCFHDKFQALMMILLSESYDNLNELSFCICFVKLNLEIKLFGSQIVSLRFSP